MNTEQKTVIYRRPANKSKDGTNGMLYMYIWETGHEELIFPSHEQARSFALDKKAAYILPAGESSKK